jgi:O-antigen/teichoic acid export membrane protein
LRSRPGLLASTSITASAAITAAASFGLTVYIAHRSGLRLLGEYAVIATVYAVILVVDASRIQDLTTRYTAGGRNDPARIRLQIFGVGLVIAAAGAGLYGAVAGARAGEGAALAWVGAVLQIMSAEVVAATQVRNSFTFLASANTGGALVGTSVAAALLTRYGLLGLGLGLFITSTLSRGLLLTRHEIRTAIRDHPVDGPILRSQSLSLTLLGGAAQLVNVTDVLSVRALASAAQVGVYRAGSQIPTVLVGLLYRGYDTLMPRLAAATEEDAATLVRRTAPKLAVVTGVTLGLLVGLRAPLVRLVLGHSNHDTETVLWLFAAVWIANSGVHPAALLLIARRRQQQIVRLVLAEYLANLVLTIALVPAFGAVGSAVATLITLAVSNLVVLPIVLANNHSTLPIARHLALDCLVPSVAAAGVTIAVTTLVS